MSDDIVTRIREHLYGEPTKTSEFLLKLAANEIERLRAEIERQDAEILEINMLWNADKAKLEALRDV